ncbi:MAG: type III pantothenate kinase [Chloroflexota bacterium]|nr:type III pantothenate kinase [Chloroflexota bacterium]
MLIALDVGNTTITLGAIEGGTVSGGRRAATRATATDDELELLLDGLLGLDGRALADVDEIVLVSVVPAVTLTLAALCRRRGIRLHVADATSVPLAIRVERPAEVGADRLVNALAAARLHGVPAIVVDFGTATNFDVVDGGGAYVGGALAPGLELGIEALAARTAKLPRIELARPARAIGTTTVAAMQSGALIGYVGLVRELLAAIRAELAEAGGPAPKVILTGGLSAAPWAGDIPGVDVIDPQLTLRGLAIVHAEATAAATAR